ncbi:hypothetical protein ACFPZ0_16475 [Streptomonospora nanhaiensis]|uniref:Uncharacterized protein n=1 Tax=Streptomonospora nanhaiensis TaxID=1323731 RepID=A0A853BN67_9ACTN|nr:hypothetical protein [Streptomonospora nanhaiensis]MBV2362077.1 hypothetical protein [Streptomonospora nanhaiensis]MBX9391043.1 hypothetical protein [Streptomonospora nanhaiensis]NYI96097.1 hypothetical protein [Streptomonospora nanhaiensis]
MNNEALNRLRVPAAWALLGAVIAHMLGGLIYLFGHGGVGYETTIAGNFTDVGSGMFHGPVIVALIVVAVLLAVTAPQKTSVNFPIALVGLILLGFAALMGVIGLIMGFVAANETAQLADGFSSFLSIGGQLAIIVFAGLFLLRVFNDQSLVPRSAPMHSGAPMGGQPGHPAPTGGQASFAPQTGAQQSFAAPQTGGFATGGQQSFQQQPQQPQQGEWGGGAQPAYAEPAQPQYSADPAQQPSGYAAADPGQQTGYDPAAQQPQADWQSAAYSDPNQQTMVQGWGQQPGQDPYQQPGGQQDPYQQGYGTGGQQSAYGQDWGGQQGQTHQADPADPLGQQNPQAQPGQPGQQGYGQDWQQQSGGGYDPYAQNQQSAYGTGEQQSYGSGGQPAYGSGDPSGYGSGGQTGYGAGAQSGGYPSGGQQPYGSGDQGGYGTGGQQAGYGSPYDPAQYAPQPGSEGEQAAQNAIQYGWYQQPGEQPQPPQEQPQPPADQRRDTPLDSFFHDDKTSTDQLQQVDPGYGSGYGQGAGYGTDPKQGKDASDTPPGWYRDDDRR